MLLLTAKSWVNLGLAAIAKALNLVGIFNRSILSLNWSCGSGYGRDQNLQLVVPLD